MVTNSVWLLRVGMSGSQTDYFDPRAVVEKDRSSWRRLLNMWEVFGTIKPSVC